MNKWIVRGAVAVAAVAFVGVAGMGLSQAQDAIKARQAIMKDNGEQMKALKAVVDAKGKPGDAAAAATKLAAGLKSVGAHWPAGSDKGETKALAVIWEKKADFDKALQDAIAAAGKLEGATKQADAAVYAASFGDMGKTCGGCHNTFRQKQN